MSVKHLEVEEESLMTTLNYAKFNINLYDTHKSSADSNFILFIALLFGLHATAEPPFIDNSEDWSVFTINDTLDLKNGEKNEF